MGVSCGLPFRMFFRNPRNSANFVGAPFVDRKTPVFGILETEPILFAFFGTLLGRVLGHISAPSGSEPLGQPGVSWGVQKDTQVNLVLETVPIFRVSCGLPLRMLFQESSKQCQFCGCTFCEPENTGFRNPRSCAALKSVKNNKSDDTNPP
mgnify:CR=1 FL=1